RVDRLWRMFGGLSRVGVELRDAEFVEHVQPFVWLRRFFERAPSSRPPPAALPAPAIVRRRGGGSRRRTDPVPGPSASGAPLPVRAALPPRARLPPRGDGHARARLRSSPRGRPCGPPDA